MNTFQIKNGLEHMDLTAIHEFLSQGSYWANGIPLQTVETSLRNSFCVGIFNTNTQIGFARIVTDYSTFAYLADVYIQEKHRGKGLSKMLMSHVMELPWMKGLRRILLVTLDAHGLYRQFGFQTSENPDWIMEITRKDLYKKVQT